MKIPGRAPAKIAVDEAHCLLHWKYETVGRGCKSLNND